MGENMFNKFNDSLKKLTEKKEKKVSATPTSDKERARKKLLKIVGMISALLIVIFLIILLGTVLIGTNYSFDQMELELKKAAIKYYQVQDVLLPADEGVTTEVDDSTLSSENYKLMKPLNKMRKNVQCTGKVVVQKINNEYIYTPYLDCGKKYKTEELYQAVKSNNKAVTSGNGLYEMNGEYVFRGDSVDNYVKLSKGLFRIVKITSENKILLIPEFDEYYYSVWDDRYNSTIGYSTGINNYRLSRLKDDLFNIYNDNIEKFILLSNTDKEKLTTFSLCIGKRSDAETNNTGAVECADTLDNQMIGLLTASDYINASLDQNCVATNSKACQNYNYLKIKDTSWWLITSSTKDTASVYRINNYGYIVSSSASTLSRIRPTVMLNNNVMIKSGKGTKSDPFILK